ncbi:MAG: 2-iminoacetate synthase ThiH [Halodesulfovibrio sp.]
MAFAQVMEQYAGLDVAGMMERVTVADVQRTLSRRTHTPEDLLVLLSPVAAGQLEAMAQRANQLSVQHFGRTIQLFTPMYISNFCTNQCIYCGFNTRNSIRRTKLDDEQIRREGQVIAATGLKQLLLLTGEAPKIASVEYIGHAAKLLRDLFPSIGVEVFALTQEEYEHLITCGVDSMTMFQETYNAQLYPKLHPAGPKSDYGFRLDAPERACKAGMRVVNIGALLGLDDWRKDAFFTGLHAHYLQHAFPQTDIAISFPRMRPHAGEFQPASIVDDRQLVQIMLAQRIVLPRCGITISSREAPAFRDNLVPLGVTRMSAGVTTAVGGHTSEEEEVGQFEISDPRSVDEMCAAIRAHGYQPVFKDWEPLEKAVAV